MAVGVEATGGLKFGHELRIIGKLRIAEIVGMITVTAAEFQRHFGRYQDEALTQPVAITRNGRERLVMISVDEYRKLKRRSREVIRVEDLSDEEVAQIVEGRMASRHDHLDAELK
jgi:prevent-host-death family protein